MTKHTERENYRIEVTIDTSHCYVTDSIGKHQVLLARAKALQAQIRRHCDGFQSVHPEFDVVHTCSFCGRPWTEDSDDYNGGCCEKDEESNTPLPSTSTEQP